MTLMTLFLMIVAYFIIGLVFLGMAVIVYYLGWLAHDIYTAWRDG